MNVFKNVKNMPELMAWADVAISAGGSTCWEMAFMGVPILVIVLAENQKDIALELEKAGAAASIGEWKEGGSLWELKKVLKRFIHSPKRLMDMSKRGKTLIDGKGARRVVQAMSNVSIAGNEMASP
jgi:spore coat polysaccharide biosynthesis predicted glycosyltransferase SpsG